ncbi:hypothetical protein [Streptomyces sp. AK04-3B]|uniref:hypothetical protein n=1 Tax=Streptomyces sp. AK04-3B TaxID=3028650 RepID=UPI0029A52AEE|nr:hypothetical protein [Streptomyces sp. AK04-3B]MDX3801365.1 hypothetical protein [Streptomyces sp. AK04-3B]
MPTCTHAEAFGPVRVLDAFAAGDEAVADAKDSDHGLTAGVARDRVRPAAGAVARGRAHGQQPARAGTRRRIQYPGG